MLGGDTALNRRTDIAWIAVAMLLFSTVDASVKYLAQSLPASTVVWFRLVAHVVISAVLLAPTYGRALVRVNSWRLNGVRAAMFALMRTLNMWALQHLQLAAVAAIQISVPILIALLSVWRLGERLNARRGSAICVGFTDVLLVIPVRIRRRFLLLP